MARPKVGVRVPLPTDPSRTLRRAEGQQVTATAPRPSTGSVKENDNQFSVGNSTAPVVQLPGVQVKTEQNFSPALEEKLPLETPISATISSAFPGAEGQQVTATALWPSTGSVKENDKQFSAGNSTASVVQDLIRPPRPQLPADQVKTEQNCSSALGEKLFLETPISTTNIPSTFPEAEGLQATAPAVRPSTRLDEEEHGHGSGGKITVGDMIERRERARLEKTNQNTGPASASISTAAVVKVEGVDAGTGSLMPCSNDSQGVSVSKKRKVERKASIVGKKPRAARGLKLSFEDLVSDAHLRLKDKAEKLRVSMSLFKNRRKSAGLGRWPGRRVRAEINREQAQARA